jgi:SAM-dependent methyltransferase
MNSENEYVLGTHDDEVARLGLQHRAWYPFVSEAWKAAEIGRGQTVLDVGCGPGYASLDLAETVGARGRVEAVDKSQRFIDCLEAACRQRGLSNINMHLADLETDALPVNRVDRVWCRWLLCFVKNPRALLARMVNTLGPSGRIVIHEYFDYATWRAAPPFPEMEDYVKAVMNSWRATGGEPDIALQIPHWLEESGLQVVHARPIVNVVAPGSMLWSWLRTFTGIGRQRLVDLGYLERARSEKIWSAFTEFESVPQSRLITPGVLEIIAVRS